MAHGKKKWIKDYRGKIKRSNNRTYYDKLGDIKVFHPWRKNHNCNACNKITDPITRHNKKVREERFKLEDEYEAKFPKPERDDPSDRVPAYIGTELLWYHSKWHRGLSNYVQKHETLTHVYLPWEDRMCEDCKYKETVRDQNLYNRPRDEMSYRYTKQVANRKYRHRDNQTLRQINVENEDDLDDVNFERRANTVRWNYW